METHWRKAKYGKDFLVNEEGKIVGEVAQTIDGTFRAMRGVVVVGTYISLEAAKKAAEEYVHDPLRNIHHD